MLHSLYLKIKSNNQSSIIVISLALFILSALFAIFTGPHYVPDSATYKMWADQLIENNFDPFRFNAIRDELAKGAIWGRMGFIQIVALLSFLMGEEWGYGVMLLNCISLAVVTYMLIQISRNLGISFWGTGFIFLSMLLIYEQLYWVAYVLSDTIFELLITGIFFSICCALIKPDLKAKRSWLFAAGIFVILSAFYRPTVVAAAPFFVGGMLTVGLQIFYPRAQVLAVRCFFVLSIAGGLLTMVLWAWYMSHPEFWEVGPFSAQIEFAYRFIKYGIIIHDRPYTFAIPPSSMFDILVIEFTRLLAFFQFYTSTFSHFHNWVNTATFVPLYILALIGTGVTIKSLFKHDREPLLIGLFAVILIMSLAIFHALTLIDYDWRYRIPCYPPLIILALLGLKSIKEKFFSQATSYSSPYAV